MPQTKTLQQMSADEIAQLTPDQFQELAHEHNDRSEWNEGDYQRQIDRARTLTDAELRKDRSHLEIKRGVEADFREQGLPVGADVYTVSNERRLNAVTDEEVRRYNEHRPAGMKDEDLNQEVQRLRGKGHEITQEDKDRLLAAEYEHQARNHQRTRPMTYVERLRAEQALKGETLADLAPRAQDRQQGQEDELER